VPKSSPAPKQPAAKVAPATASGPAAKGSPVKAAAKKPEKVVTKAAEKTTAKPADKRPAPAAPAPETTKAASKSPAARAAKADPKPEPRGETKAAPAKPAKAAAKAGKAGETAKGKEAANGEAAASGGFDTKFLREQRELLLAERAKLLHQAEELEGEAASLMEDLDPGDVQFDDESGEGDSLVVERERDLALSAQAREMIGLIDAALGRLDTGTYGLSLVSGRPIPRERLQAIPWATELVEEKVGGFGGR
jgi:RNA polymerase-binding transcription factor DksA